jgi:hypothetical protein
VFNYENPDTHFEVVPARYAGIKMTTARLPQANAELQRIVGLIVTPGLQLGHYRVIFPQLFSNLGERRAAFGAASPID